MLIIAPWRPRFVSNLNLEGVLPLASNMEVRLLRAQVLESLASVTTFQDLMALLQNTGDESLRTLGAQLDW